MLARTALYLLVVQALVISVIASAVPHGAGWLTSAGFVTAYYDSNVFAVKIAPIPWTDPSVYASVQSVVQMLAVALAGAALFTIARTNPWHHGALPDSLPPPKDRGPAKVVSPAPPPGTSGGGPPAPPRTMPVTGADSGAPA